jgi:hypothetical protein
MTPTQIKYAVMAVGFLAWTAIVGWTVADYKDAKHAQENAKQADIANALYIDALNEKARLEREKTDLAMKVDETHAKAKADADATADEFDRKLRDAKRRACSGRAPSGQAPNPGISPDTAGSGDSGPRTDDPRVGRKLRDYALDLQRYAKACHEWAWGVGR